MFVQPIIDLWTMKPFAYALVTASGELYKAMTPHQLYECMDAAYFREMTPLVVWKLEVMQDESWSEFVKHFPDMDIYTYENGVVTGRRNQVLMTDEGPAYTQWVKGISDNGQLEDLKRSSVRFGSGPILAEPDQLVDWTKRKKKPSMVKWA